jgi:ferric-dicitrate binding protein FerR (iron transport regulator)
MSDEEWVESVDRRWIEAFDWHTLVRGESDQEFTHEKYRELLTWKADSENLRVFNQVCTLIGAASHLPAGAFETPLGQQKSCDFSAFPGTEDKVSAGGPMSPQMTAGRVGRRNVRYSAVVLLTIAASFFGAVVGFLSPARESLSQWWFDVVTSHTESYETAVGQVRQWSLPDGSTVVLGANSAVSVRFSPARRLVKLDRGEALFRVAHDANRPFDVLAGGTRIRAVGTRFDVQRDADRVTITVAEGIVQVATPAGTQSGPDSPGPSLPDGPPTPTQVTAGQQVTYENGLATPLVEHADVEAATGWSQGRLVFRQVSLRRVIEVLNRYSRHPISLDPLTGDHIITAVVRQEEIDAWMCRLEDIYPVEVDEHGPQISIRPRDPTRTQTASECDDRN